MIAVLFFCSVGGVFLLAHDATGTNITLLIIIHAQLINARAFVRRSMGELAVSDVDADMRYAIAAAGVKKTRSPGRSSLLLTFSPTSNWEEDERGRSMLNLSNTYFVKPEQSKPLVVEPPYM